MRSTLFYLWFNIVVIVTITETSFTKPLQKSVMAHMVFL